MKRRHGPGIDIRRGDLRRAGLGEKPQPQPRVIASDFETETVRVPRDWKPLGDGAFRKPKMGGM